MHDIDRTVREFEHYEQETGPVVSYDTEFGGDSSNEFNYEFGDNEYNYEGETAYGGVLQEMQTYECEQAVFDEVEEMELASQLLEVQSDAELDEFLGKLVKRAASAAGKFIKSPVGKQLVGALKGVAKKALPIAGAALGNMIVPGVGGAIGGKLASAAGSMFGLELEGLSQEDREFEVRCADQSKLRSTPLITPQGFERLLLQ